MDFGFTLKPEHSVERIIALTRQAEAAGFSYGRLFDAHAPFKEVYPPTGRKPFRSRRCRRPLRDPPVLTAGTDDGQARPIADALRAVSWDSGRTALTGVERWIQGATA